MGGFASFSCGLVMHDPRLFFLESILDCRQNELPHMRIEEYRRNYWGRDVI